MEPEIEAVFIGIDKDALRDKLRSLGATCKIPERLMTRTVFKTSEPDGAHSFLRVRNEGDKVVVTYKKFINETATGVGELNLAVADYDKAVELFKHLHFHAKSYEESYRETWELDGAEIDIDTWPWLPPYVEVEGQSVENMTAVSEKLGFDIKDAIYDSVGGIYELYYDVSQNDINSGKDFWSRIEFKDAPAALMAKRR